MNTYRVTGTYIAKHEKDLEQPKNGSKVERWLQRIEVDELVEAERYDDDDIIDIAARQVAGKFIDFNTFVGDNVNHFVIRPATPEEITAHESHVALMQMQAQSTPLFDLNELMMDPPTGADCIDIVIENVPQGATNEQLATIAEALAQVPPKFDLGELIMATIDSIAFSQVMQSATEAELATIIGALNHAAANAQ